MEITFTTLIESFMHMAKDPYMHIVMGIIVLDIITGYAKAFVQHKLNSSVGLAGLCKHIVMMLIIVAAYPYLTLLGFKGIAYSIIIFYIATYGISLIENLNGMGITVPSWIAKRLTKIKTDLDNEGDK